MELDEFNKKVKDEILKYKDEYRIFRFMLLVERVSLLLSDMLKERYIYKVEMPLVEEIVILFYVDQLYYFGEEGAKKWLESYLPYITDLEKRLDKVYNDLVKYLRISLYGE